MKLEKSAGNFRDIPVQSVLAALDEAALEACGFGLTVVVVCGEDEEVVGVQGRAVDCLEDLADLCAVCFGCVGCVAEDLGCDGLMLALAHMGGKSQ